MKGIRCSRIKGEIHKSEVHDSYFVDYYFFFVFVSLQSNPFSPGSISSSTLHPISGWKWQKILKNTKTKWWNLKTQQAKVDFSFFSSKRCENRRFSRNKTFVITRTYFLVKTSCLRKYFFENHHIFKFTHCFVILMIVWFGNFPGWLSCTNVYSNVIAAYSPFPLFLFLFFIFLLFFVVITKYFSSLILWIAFMFPVFPHRSHFCTIRFHSLGVHLNIVNKKDGIRFECKSYLFYLFGILIFCSHYIVQFPMICKGLRRFFFFSLSFMIFRCWCPFYWFTFTFTFIFIFPSLFIWKERCYSKFLYFCAASLIFTLISTAPFFFWIC